MSPSTKPSVLISLTIVGMKYEKVASRFDYDDANRRQVPEPHWPLSQPGGDEVGDCEHSKRHGGYINPKHKPGVCPCSGRYIFPLRDNDSGFVEPCAKCNAEIDYE